MNPAKIGRVAVYGHDPMRHGWMVGFTTSSLTTRLLAAALVAVFVLSPWLQPGGHGSRSFSDIDYLYEFGGGEQLILPRPDREQRSREDETWAYGPEFADAVDALRRDIRKAGSACPGAILLGSDAEQLQIPPASSNPGSPRAPPRMA